MHQYYTYLTKFIVDLKYYYILLLYFINRSKHNENVLTKNFEHFSSYITFVIGYLLEFFDPLFKRNIFGGIKLNTKGTLNY
jgi:hypothetical protein